MKKKKVEVKLQGIFRLIRYGNEIKAPGQGVGTGDTMNAAQESAYKSVCKKMKEIHGDGVVVRRLKFNYETLRDERV